jgi:hypothetical protein
MEYVTGIFLDFDNVYSCIYSQSPEAAWEFANGPGVWLDALEAMRGGETVDPAQFCNPSVLHEPVGSDPGTEA